MSRLLSAGEIKDAAQWFFAADVSHDGKRSGGRKYLAKRVYWAALVASGFSIDEIAGLTGAARATIMNGLDPEPPELYVTAVLAYAQSLVDA